MDCSYTVILHFFSTSQNTTRRIYPFTHANTHVMLCEQYTGLISCTKAGKALRLKMRLKAK